MSYFQDLCARLHGPLHVCGRDGPTAPEGWITPEQRAFMAKVMQEQAEVEAAMAARKLAEDDHDDNGNDEVNEQ